MKFEEISGNFLVDAPPSHYELRMIEKYSPQKISKSGLIKKKKTQKKSRENIEEINTETDGFNEDKNIDLSKCPIII